MFDFLLSYLLIYSYYLLFLVVLLASFGVPLPGTTLLIAAGALAGQGYLNISFVFISAFFASILGDITNYLLSLYFGRDVLSRIGFGKLLNSSKFSKIEEKFLNYSSWTIFITRFFFITFGPTVNLLAGISKINYKKFLFFDLTGELLFVLIFGGLGYFLGNEWMNIYPVIENIIWIIILLLLLIGVIFFVRYNNSR